MAPFGLGVAWLGNSVYVFAALSEVQMFQRRQLLIVLVAALGCSGKRLAAKSIDEVRTLLRGKSDKEVMSLFGKPAQVDQRPPSSGADEAWYYLNGARHAATGTAMTVIVKFRGGRVVEVVGM